MLDTLKMRLRKYFNLYIKEKCIQVKPNKNSQFLCLKMKTDARKSPVLTSLGLITDMNFSAPSTNAPVLTTH